MVGFAKRFLELLKWITTDEHRQVIVLNFAYYDFALIQKIYIRFYHIKSIVKRMQIAISVITLTLSSLIIMIEISSLDDAQLTHLNKMAFCSDDVSIKFFNVSSVNVDSFSIDNNTNINDRIADIDDLLIEQKDDPAIDHSIEDFDENNSIIDENDDLTEYKPRDKGDQPLRVDSYLPMN